MKGTLLASASLRRSNQASHSARSSCRPFSRPSSRPCSRPCSKIFLTAAGIRSTKRPPTSTMIATADAAPAATPNIAASRKIRLAPSPKSSEYNQPNTNMATTYPAKYSIQYVSRKRCTGLHRRRAVPPLSSDPGGRPDTGSQIANVPGSRTEFSQAAICGTAVAGRCR